MEIERYQALVTAIDTGSLRAAAEKLGYTTSGISRMMASLEGETGLTLLSRSKSGVQPTAACEKILPEIRTLLRSAQQLNEKSASLHGVISGTVRIGTAYAFYYESIARAVQHFGVLYPDVSIEISSGYSTALMEQMHNHQLDLCIISRRENPGGEWIPLCRDEMIAAVSSGSRLAKLKTFPVSGFASHSYIQTHPNVDSDSARVFQKCGITPNTKFRTEDSMATFAMVAADLGVTMNNRLNALLWKRNDIVTLPLRPRQRIEIGISLAPDAEASARAFARELV